MNLFTTQTESFCYVNKSHIPDGEGGVATVWVDGAKFQAAAILNNSTQAKLAAQMGVTSVYTIWTDKQICLEYYDVIKRISDNKIFRITSDGKDNKTPDNATLKMRKVSAEEWRIPND